MIFVAKVKLAFGNDDDGENDKKKRNNHDILTENDTILTDHATDRHSRTMNSNKNYERALFTIHNITVLITLENDTLSWATITGESTTKSNIQN